MNQKEFEGYFKDVAVTEQDTYDVRWEFTLKGNSPEDVVRYVVLQLLQHPDFPQRFFQVRNRRTGEVVAKDFEEDISKD